MQRILVVEDDTGTRSLVTQILQRSGFQIAEAENGLRALELLEDDDQFDLILSDLRMNLVDGLQLLSEVKIHWPAIPVIILSVYSMSDWIQEAFDKGAADYIIKPFTQHQLIDSINHALGERQP